MMSMPGVCQTPKSFLLQCAVASHPDMHDMMRDNTKLAQKMWMESTASALIKFQSAHKELACALTVTAIDFGPQQCNDDNAFSHEALSLVLLLDHLQDLAEVKHNMQMCSTSVVQV